MNTNPLIGSKRRMGRSSAPKSRNGCITCKLRRVKCDERQPQCNNCIKSYRVCQWKSTSVDSGTKQRILLPQNVSRLNQTRPSQVLRFTDQSEVSYFRVYQEEAASELSGIFKTSVWNYTILQACHSNPFALRAVVALGALYKSMKKSHTISATISSVQVSDIDVASRHLAFALKAYDRAISGMRSVTPVPEKTLSLRKVLIACLLVYCVEQFLKSPNTAYRQGQSGYALLREWMARKPNRLAGLSSPDSNVVEDELFQELSRLELQHALRWGEHELLRHQVRKQEGTSSVKTMPAQFTSLDEGRRYQELIMRRSSHLIGEIYACIISSKLESGHETADSPGELVDPCHVPTKLLDERDEYILDIRRWHAAFCEIGSKLIASPDPFISMGAALLRIQAMDSEISLAGAFFTEECSFDTFLPEAREILALSRLFSNRSKKMWPEATPIFNLSTGIERPLFGVAVWCRDKELRHEALDILCSEASRDPTKDKARMVTRASYMIWLEEQGRQEDGTIPERARFREIWKLHHYKETSRGLTMICARRLGYPIGREYPAKREWTRITFTQSEIDSFEASNRMLRGEFQHPEYQPWPGSLQKPAYLKWKEVHRDLQLLSD